MNGDVYKLFGTDVVFEVTGQGKSYWIAMLRSAKGEEIRVHIEKSAFANSVREKQLEKLEKIAA